MRLGFRDSPPRGGAVSRAARAGAAAPERSAHALITYLHHRGDVTVDEALQYTTITTSQLRHSPDTQSVLKKQKVGEGTRLSCSLARSARELGSSWMCSKHALGLGNSAVRPVLGTV